MATAVQVESIWNGLTDNSGQPLAAGKVYTYAAGTTTPVSLYTASDKTSSATNPLILDGNGKAQVWADGRYKFVVKTAADVTLYTLDNLLYGFDDTTVLLGGISTGSANAQVVSVPATVESYANGQRITFIAGFTNTGATTLKFNSLAAISIVKGPTPSSLQAGDLLAGQLYSCTYYGGSFYLENSPTPADVQRSRAQLITGISGSNTITGALTPAITGYEVGQVFRFKATGANTSAVTLAINGLTPPVAVQRYGTALVGGEIQANDMVEVVYDGTQFQMVNAVPAPLFINRTNSRVGIGTTAPYSSLDVLDSFQLGASATATNNFHITANSSGGFAGNLIIWNGNNGAGTERMRIDSAGRVGIGAPSTGARLLVAAQGTGGAATEFLQIAQTAAVDNATSRIAFYNYNGIAGAIDSIQNAASNFQSQLVFSTQTGSGMTEKMRITSGGYVGINTASPNGFLSVQFDGSADDFCVGRDITGANYVVSKSIYDRTTVAGTNVAVESTAGSYPVRRVGSSIKYKKDVVDLDPAYADKLHQFRPVFFKSKCFGDHPEWTHYGFIAEELAEIEPRFVSFGYQPDDYEEYEFTDENGDVQKGKRLKADAQAEPEGVYYDRIVTFLTSIIQRQEKRIESLEARVAALEA